MLCTHDLHILSTLRQSHEADISTFQGGNLCTTASAAARTPSSRTNRTRNLPDVSKSRVFSSSRLFRLDVVLSSMIRNCLDSFCLVDLRDQMFDWFVNVFRSIAAIAQWIRLHLPSYCLGSNPKHTIYAFIIYSFCVM